MADETVSVWLLSMPRCATCKHWDPFGVIGHGTCRRIMDDDDPWAVDASEAAWIAGNEGERHPVLRTIADHGCTEHQPAETEENP